MKNNHNDLKRTLITLLLVVLSLGVYSLTPSVGGYNVYFGHLHNHTSYSDGQGTPDQAYSTAKANGLDFLGLSDHSHLLNDAEWEATLVAAESHNRENVFTTFRGFEWTSGTYGHVTIVNTPTFISTTTAYDTFSKLCTWLNTQDCIAFFNHPGYYNSTGKEFDHFTNTLATKKIVGMEFWNKTSGFSTFYYNSSNGSLVEGYITGDGMAFYDEALQSGWKIGAQGSEDNHVASWGVLANYKTAVLALANTRTDLLAAYKAKRFYSTRYNSIAMSFKIDGNEMGSTVTPGTKDIQIQVSESNTSRTVRKVELIKNGVVVKTWNPSLSNVSITETIECNNGDYYYIRTHEYYAGNPGNDYCQITAVSSPIWIEGLVQPNTPPVAMNDTETTEEDTPVTFNVTTNDYDIDGEINVTTVDLDPATSGRQTQYIVSTKGTYTADNSGNITFTPVKDYNGTTAIYYTVNDNSGAVSNIATVSINVTPVEDIQTIFFSVNSSRQIIVTCYDVIAKGAKINVYNSTTGKLMATSLMKSVTTTIKTKFSPGVYTVSVYNGSVVTTGNVIVN